MTNRNGCLQNPCGVWRMILLYSVKDQYFCYFIIRRADIFVSNLIEHKLQSRELTFSSDTISLDSD